MKSFPIFINLIHKPVLVVGGGDVALRKIDMLLKADAKITVCLLYTSDAADE